MTDPKKHNVWLPVTAAATTILLLGGCASTQTLNNLKAQQKQWMQQTRHVPQPTVTSSKTFYVHPKIVRYVSGGVSLTANGLALNAALAAVMPKTWSLNYAKGVNAHTSVHLDIRHRPIRTAIQQVAMSAGYVAIIHPDRQSVTISTYGTFIFHIPTGLINGQSANLSVSSSNAVDGSSGGSMGGSPMGVSGGSTSSGMPSMPGTTNSTMGSSSGGSNGSSFSIEATTARSDVLHAIRTLAGPHSVVSMDKSSGILTVTAKAGGLRRVTDYIKRYVRIVDTQIAIHAAIIQISLDKGLSTGVNWNRILNMAGTMSTGLAAPIQSTASLVSGATATSFNITATGVSFSGVLNALQQSTRVDVLTEPELTTDNGVPATINSGTEIPYLGNISSSVTGTVGTTTSGASLSYATNGVSLSFIPEFLGNNIVQLAIVPSLSNVESMQSFPVSGNMLKGPITQQDQSFVRLTAKSGETLIIGGTMQTQGKQGRAGIPGFSQIPALGILFGNYNQSSGKSQMVLLVHVKVLPAPAINPLIGETL